MDFEPAGGRQVSVGVLPKKTQIDAMPEIDVPRSRLLSVQVYKTLSDAVLLDWFISLNDKDTMSECDVAYTAVNATSSASSGAYLLSPFLPRHRSFVLPTLEPDQTYQLLMSCVDRTDTRYSSEYITFTTGKQFVTVSSKGNNARCRKL